MIFLPATFVAVSALEVTHGGSGLNEGLVLTKVTTESLFHVILRVEP